MDGTCNRMFCHQLDALLDNAFWEGSSWQILNFLHEVPEDEYLEIVAKKIVESLNSYIDFLDQHEAIVKNILKILTDFIEKLKNNPEQSLVLSECMLRIGTDERVPVNILKCAVYNLNILLKVDGPVRQWLREEESLEGFLLILGRKLSIVGDFECQSNIFETLCYIVYDNENKDKWIQSWFTDDEKTQSMFLNWDLENFTVVSRRILNQINSREQNPRTYAFVAKAVYFGNVQLKKLDDLEFWIDFNYETESISFFCKDFEGEDQDSSQCWETVVIPSEIVESYSVQKKEDTKFIELSITLNCSCSNLLLTPNPLFDSTNLIRMHFWMYVDISSHLKVIFGDPVTLANNYAFNSQESHRSRKVSNSIDAFEMQDQNDGIATQKIRKISTSDVVKIQAEDNCEKKERRISDSTKLISLSDDACNFHKTNILLESNDSYPKRKVSSCSLILKESDSERSFQISNKNKQPRFKFVRTISTDNQSKSNEKLTNEDDGDTNQYCFKESSSQIFRSERKSSNAACAIDYRSDTSDIIIDTDDRKFKEMSESPLKKKHKFSQEKHLDDTWTLPEGVTENKNMSYIELDGRHKFQEFVQNPEVEELVSNGYEKQFKPIKKESILLKDSSIVRNSNESAKVSQKDKKSFSSEGSQNSQKRAKKVDSSIKASQETSSHKNDKNGFLENFIEKGQIEYQSKQPTSENEHHFSDNEAVSSETRRIKSKKNADQIGKRKSSIGRPSKRKSNDGEKEVISDETTPKKRRKAAIKAMERNKTMLGQKDARTEGFSEKSSNVNHSNDEIEVFCTPPTKPVKKRRLKSVFLTDTETGSSSVSWIGGKNSYLFETPQKRYSKRMKYKRTSKSTSLKKKTYKPMVGNSKRKRNFAEESFEKKSKTGLSDLENYELVVERKMDRKKSSGSQNFTFEDVSKAINAAMEGMVNKQSLDDEPDEESNNLNIESQICDNNQGFDYDRVLHSDESKVKEDLIITERNQTKISKNSLKSNIADEQSVVDMNPKPSSSNKRHSRSDQSLFQEKDSSYNLEVHQKSVSNDLPLSDSGKKRKLAYLMKKNKSDNLYASKEKAKRNKKNSNCSLRLDSVTDDCDSIVHDKTLPKTPPTLVVPIPKSSKILENDKNSLSSSSKEPTETCPHPDSVSPKVGILTEQSLSSLVSENDEAAGKEFHMQRFLDELSGESNSPKYFECAVALDPVATLQSSKTSKSYLSSRSGDLLEHSTFEKYPTEEVKLSHLSSAREKHFTSFEESNERSKASSEKGLQKFSLLDHYLDSGLQEECFERSIKEDNHQKVTKINGKKQSKQLSVLHILGVATDDMTQKLLKTLQKHFYNLIVKITDSREKMLEMANALISKENDWNHKDLKNFAKTYKMKRIQAEKSLNQILLTGQEYFEAERKLDFKMKRLHKKALKKYAARIKLAGRYAVDALEERAATKTEVLLKSILKKIKNL